MQIALDLDGTIVDARRRQTALALACLESAGVAPIDAGQFWALKRDGRSTAGALSDLNVPADDVEEIARLWTAQIESPRWLSLDRMLPGAHEAIDTIRAHGHAPFILTARRDSAALLEQIASLALSFAVTEIEVVDPRDAVAQKAAVLGSRGAEAFVGDTESDARAAALAGVPFLAVSSGQRSSSALRRLGVAAPLRDIGEAVAKLVSPGA